MDTLFSDTGLLSLETSSMTEKEIFLLPGSGFESPAAAAPEGSSSSMDSSIGVSETAVGGGGGTAADVIELELSEMFSVLCRLIDHKRRGLSLEADLKVNKVRT